MNNYQFMYGHKLDAEEIRKKYPFCNVKVSERIAKSKIYTITFDARMAYSYRRKGYNVIVWGGIYRGVTVFVFRKRRISMRSLPFR